MNIDLHMHTTCSDGVLTPKELMNTCKDVGLQVVSVTDHDTIDQVEPCTAFGREYGIFVVSGSELSVVFNGKELHMLAYGFDVSRSDNLKSLLRDIVALRKTRAAEAAQKLQGCGFAIDLKDILALADGAIGRPHIAQAVLNRVENTSKLSELGISSLGQVIESFLDKGKPAYVPRAKLAMDEAIALVHDAGGITVLAHPGWTFRRNFREIPHILSEMKAIGLDGVESFYRTHSAEQTMLLHKTAKNLNLYETTGSDFHNPADELFGQLGTWDNYGLTPNYPPFVDG